MIHELHDHLGQKSFHKNQVAVMLFEPWNEGEAEKRWNRSSMRSLEALLLELPKPRAQIHRLLGALYAVAGRWNVKHRQAPSALPRISYYRQRATNPLRQNPATALRLHRQVSTELEEIIRETSAGKKEADWLSLGLVSGVLHFGLLHSSLMIALLEAIAEPHDGWLISSGRVALHLSLPLLGVPKSEHRIWYPDPLTAALLLRVEPEAARAILNQVSREPMDEPARQRRLYAALSAHVAGAVELSASGRKPRPLSLTTLMRASQQAAQFYLSFQTVAYLRRRLVSHSLRPEVLARLDPSTRLMQSPADQAMLQGESRSSGGREEKTSAATRNSGSDRMLHPLITAEHMWLTLLRGRMRVKTLREVRDALIVLGREPGQCPLLRRLTELGVALTERKGHKPLQPATLSTYLVLLGKFLGPRIGTDDPVELARNGMDEIYLEAIEDHQDSPSGGSLSAQRRFARCLLMFHRFLTEKYEARPLEEGIGFNSGSLPVDANIVSEQEYLQVFSALEVAESIPPGQRIFAQMLLLLGYRCGLRRNEAHYLRPGDIDRDQKAVLLNLRDTPERRLKTANAPRRLNLTALLKPSELNTLIKFCDRRRNADPWERLFSDSGYDDPDYCHPDDLMLKDEDLFAAIHRVMREMVGDRSMRFHHLRHSFATRTVLRLATEGCPVKGAVFEAMGRTPEAPDDLRAKLFETTKVRGIDLKAVANMLGHGSARMSLEHYIHSMDLVALAEIEASGLTRTLVQVMVAASGLPESSAYRIGRDDLAAIPRRLFEHRFRSLLRPRSAPRSTATRASTPVDPLEEALEFLLLQQGTRYSLTSSGAQRGSDFENAAELMSRWKSALVGIGAGKSELSGRSQTLVADLIPRLKSVYRARPGLVREALTIFSERFWPSRGYCLFSGAAQTEQAKTYLKYLDRLGIPVGHIRLVLFCPEDSATGRSLKKALGLKGLAVTVRRPSNPNSEASKRAVGLVPLFPQTALGGKGRSSADAGFHALMHFASATLRVPLPKTMLQKQS
jgi:integrase